LSVIGHPSKFVLKPKARASDGPGDAFKGKPVARRGRKAQGSRPPRRPGCRVDAEHQLALVNEEETVPPMPMLVSRSRRVTVAAALAVAALAPTATQAQASSPDFIVRAEPGVDSGRLSAAVHRAGGVVIRDLHVIRGLGVRIGAAGAARLARQRAVASVTRDAPVTPSAVPLAPTTGSQISASALLAAHPFSSNATRAWQTKPYGTGRGVGVAVIDTGVAGDVIDFRASSKDVTSRVVASAVVNPYATTATDYYGHGTHVAGLIAGNGWNRTTSDPLRGRYIGTAPEANLISVKVSDDHGEASLIDVIYGIQFAVDQRKAYGIRVINLSLNSSVAQDPDHDPLDAAVEAAWFKGLVVVAAAGNRGTASDAVAYAPANDPYALTVGAVDDRGTTGIDDDVLADWSSRGLTQTGASKPEILAPGAHIVSTLAPASDFSTLCPGCVVNGNYFRVGGTSMAAAVVSGAAAVVIQTNPTWSNDAVKGALMNAFRDVSGTGREVSVDKARRASVDVRVSNVGLHPSALIDPATGGLDYPALGIAPATWSPAVDPLRARWSSGSFTCDCVTASTSEEQTADTSRARWSRARWSAEFTK
jgi:serine protease AprX